MACRISNCEINRWIWSASVRGKGDPSIAVSRHKRGYWCHTPQGSVSDAQTERNRTPLRNLTPVSFKLHSIRKAFTQLLKLPPCTIHQYITEVHDTLTASPIIPAAQTRCFISTPAPLSLSAEGQGRETWVGRTKLAIMSGMIMAVLHSDPSAPSFKFSVMMGLNYFFFFLSPALEKKRVINFGGYPREKWPIWVKSNSFKWTSSVGLLRNKIKIFYQRDAIADRLQSPVK